MAGCASTPASQKYAAIPAKEQPPAQAAKDTAACEDSAQAYYDENKVGAVVFGGFGLGLYSLRDAYQRKYKDCMVERGYSFKD